MASVLLNVVAINLTAIIYNGAGWLQPHTWLFIGWVDESFMIHSPCGIHRENKIQIYLLILKKSSWYSQYIKLRNMACHSLDYIIEAKK